MLNMRLGCHNDFKASLSALIATPLTNSLIDLQSAEQMFYILTGVKLLCRGYYHRSCIYVKPMVAMAWGIQTDESRLPWADVIVCQWDFEDVANDNRIWTERTNTEIENEIKIRNGGSWKRFYHKLFQCFAID